jgi:hypothetical protein
VIILRKAYLLMRSTSSQAIDGMVTITAERESHDTRYNERTLQCLLYYVVLSTVRLYVHTLVTAWFWTGIDGSSGIGTWIHDWNWY